MTSEMATTKKRRKYMGAVPKAIELKIGDIVEDIHGRKSQLVSIDSADIHIPPIAERKKRGRPPKVASGNNPT